MGMALKFNWLKKKKQITQNQCLSHCIEILTEFIWFAVRFLSGLKMLATAVECAVQAMVRQATIRWYCRLRSHTLHESKWWFTNTHKWNQYSVYVYAVYVRHLHIYFFFLSANPLIMHSICVSSFIQLATHRFRFIRMSCGSIENDDFARYWTRKSFM